MGALVAACGITSQTLSQPHALQAIQALELLSTCPQAGITDSFELPGLAMKFQRIVKNYSPEELRVATRRDCYA